MKHVATAVAVLLLGAVLMAALLPPSHAQMETMMGNTMSETLTLPADEYKAYGVSLTTSVPLTFSIHVTMGGPVDIYLMNATGYAEYKDPMQSTFGYYPAGTRENTMSFSGTFTAPRAGTYYMVVDNAPISSSGAMGATAATVQVSAQVGTPPVDSSLVLVAIVVVAVLGVGSTLIALSIRKKRKHAAALPPVVPPTAWPPGSVVPPPGPAWPGTYPPTSPPLPPPPPRPPGT